MRWPGRGDAADRAAPRSWWALHLAVLAALVPASVLPGAPGTAERLAIRT